MGSLDASNPVATDLDSPAYWYATSGHDLERMMQLAGIPETAQNPFLEFYRTVLCPALGARPGHTSLSCPSQRSSVLGWEGNPFEYSFEFKGSTKKAGVRFAADFTEHRPNNSLHPLSMSQSRHIIDYLRTRVPGFDSTWNDAFDQFFSVEDISPEQQESLIPEVGFQTPIMLGFDIKPGMLDPSSPSSWPDIVPLMLKSYYTPHYISLARNMSNNFDAIKASIQRLPNLEQTSPNILKALDMLDSYLSTKPQSYKQSAQYMATDFVSPAKARLKIYFRFYNPSPGKDYEFDDIWEYYTLGERIPGLDGDRDMLRDLIDLVGGHTSPSSLTQNPSASRDKDIKWKTDKVRVSKTRRKPIALYFSLTPDTPYPTPKLYYNPAQSSKLPDDLSIARGIDGWMEKYGWADGGLSVEERAGRVFSHRQLEEKNGIFTFVAFGRKEDGGVQVIGSEQLGELGKKFNKKVQTSLSVYMTPEFVLSPPVPFFPLIAGWLPAYLYRVMYCPSQTRYSAAGWLEARDTQKFASHEPFDRDEFRDMVLNHIDWNSGGKSPFISLLPGPCGAVDWGRALRPNNNWDLVEIETAELLWEGVRLFKLVDVSDKLGIDLPAKKSSYLRFEYLCLHRVPPNAITQKVSKEKIPSDTILPWIENLRKQQPQRTPRSVTRKAQRVVFADASSDEEIAPKKENLKDLLCRLKELLQEMVILLKSSSDKET
ncbi:tryptophan dimethylallyltransferase-domain-containing protein [Rhypophila decipiens]|uniref:Tryptophan dimethylallyltransferase-domain-containing protein n=1 Tax=Rhypophila decipiens TaxID=261697 RepID=A0AAN6Y0B3_9PEZI|nr:tryptophan dimethylallyltransferase-domain-containing protein [Rhypophila decipiens]